MSIFKKLKGKNYKDILLRLKRILYQKRIFKKELSSFYTDKYLLKNTRFNSIDTLLKDFKNHNNKFSIFSFSNIPNEDSKQIISDANLILEHKFDLLGSGLIKISYNQSYPGLEEFNYSKTQQENNVTPNTKSLDENYDPIDWSVDYKSGYKWDNNTFYPKVRQLSSKEGVDIKLPWELSRCQHFGILAIAYNITKDTIYAKEIKNQIIDWINNNPYCYGPNWVCAMDVGIRIANWLMAYDLVKESGVFDDDFLKLFLKSICHHQEYIMYNLEWTSKLTSNHYLSDIAGIYFISTYVRVFKKSNSIHKFSIKELEKEIYVQTYDDGMNSEGSTSYHRLVLEIFAYCYILDSRHDKKLSKKYESRLSKMFRFSTCLIKDNGTIPQIGDNDSGVFFSFKNRAIIDHSYINTLANCLFDLEIDTPLTSPEKELLDCKREQTSNKETNKSFEFSDSGIFIYKSKEFYLSIYNGPNGQKGNGGHAHNDKLSFTMDYKGVPIFIDPGTYLYTPIPAQRNKFRSTFSHNTVSVSGEEQNRYINDYLFGLKEDCLNLPSLFKPNENGFLYEGSHDGYTRISDSLIHRRSINFNDDDKSLVINDEFDDAEYSKTAIFILNKQVFNEIKGNTVLLTNGKIEFENNEQLTCHPFVYSEAYGMIDSSSYLRLKVDFKRHLRTSIIIA